MIEIASFGFDPGLRHGAIVHAIFRFSHQRHHLDQIRVPFLWTKKQEHLGAESSPPDVASFVHQQLLPRFQIPAAVVGIEWDILSVYWRTQKKQVVTTAFMLGYLVRGLTTSGLPQVYVTPSDLKKAFSIAKGEEKEDYMQRVPQMTGHQPLVLHDHLMPEHENNSDVYDALLIAYFAAFFLYRSSYGTTNQ
jgi:hypothetical protein